MFRKYWLIGWIALLGLSGAALAENDRLLDTREGTIPAGDAAQLRLDVAAGFLEVFGQPEGSQVRYRAEFRGEDESQLDDLLFEHQLRGNAIEIRTRTDTRGWKRNGRIDLTLWVPSSMVLDIHDGSGHIKVRDMDRDVFIEDGSGSIDLEGLGANLEIDDGSGSIVVRGLDGSLRVQDGSGSLLVENVGGSVTVSDGSGSISVRDVAGDFEVAHDGSGGIDYQRIAGRVNVPEKKRKRDW